MVSRGGRWRLGFALLLTLGSAQVARAQEAPALQVHWAPEAPARGDPILITLEVETGWKVGGTFLDRRLRFFHAGKQAGGQMHALAPISVLTEAGTHPLKLILTRGAGKRRETLIRTVGVEIAEVAFEQSELRVNPRFTSPPKKALARIRRERARIKTAWRKSKKRRLWRGGFVPPTDTEKTGAFGTERVFNDRVASRHLGLDLDGRIGDPIRATARGRVVLAGHLFYTGRCVFLDHGLGLFSVYFHMSELRVKEGEWVKPGQVIGLVGRSGRVTGPHLHFGAKLQGVYVRPSTLFELEIDDDGMATP